MALKLNNSLINEEKKMIALHHIVKKEKNTNRYLLDHINLNINKGEFLAITCMDDSSTSAFLKILSLNDSDFYGEYFFESQIVGQNTKENHAKRSKDIGLVIDQVNLIDHLNVEENILLPLHHQNLTLKQKEERLSDLFETMKIGHLRSNYPGQLNDLLRFKIALAQSLILKPKLLIVGGVMEKLSEEEKKEASNLLFQLNGNGLTIIIALRKIDDANLYHRIFQLQDGKLKLKTD